MTQLLRGTIEAISVAALVTVAVYLWRRQRRLAVERAELLDREREERINVEQINRTVVIHVSRYYTPGFAEGVGDSGFAADIGERSVSIVAEEPTPCRLVRGGDAVEALSGSRVSAKLIL